ncbi:hypothetical protein GALMADRAFT_144897 [Galerina marginata CBS 339.88]|uniref:Lanthionine synthetase C family protein n=1 Tax=Galerina marginata (strain CBS 339.88) TaxID=685588 RepID=A0A067STX9_GALM3|nr:hypothetical protein GALMADRAFT_144897 [Galerina marginata CBS 339.88]
MPQSSHSHHVPLSGKPPEHPKDWEVVKRRISTTLPRDIRRIQDATKGMQVNRRETVYGGLIGIALMEYHLSGMPAALQDDLTSPALLSAADNHLAQVIHHHPGYLYNPNYISFMTSSVGTAALVLTRRSSTSEKSIANDWVAARDYLRTTIDQVLSEDLDLNSPSGMDDGCEFLYGRAGLLYALLYLRKGASGDQRREMAPFEDLIAEANLSSLVDAIICRGKHGASSLSLDVGTTDPQRLPPLLWTWRGKHYLGAAHGIAGILQVLLNCPISIIRKHIPVIFSTISWLLDCQDDSDNWPSKYPTSTTPNELVQWCLTAPGVIILLSTALRVLHGYEGMISTEGLEDKLSHSLRLSADLVYKNGLPHKGVGLCHGASGSVYALLAVSDALDTPTDRHFFSKAAHLAFLATSHEDMTASGEMTVPDRPWSLYEGLAGMCCAWAEILCRLDFNGPRHSVSGFPGYNDLAIPNYLYQARTISML